MAPYHAHRLVASLLQPLCVTDVYRNAKLKLSACVACCSDSYSRGALPVVSRERERCNAINPDGRFSVYWVAVQSSFFFL
jgi:hypothetical protein